jgi:hypothetical protein
MTTSRRLASLVFEFLSDDDVIAEFSLPTNDEIARRLVDDGNDEERPSWVVVAREDPKNASARRKVLLNVIQLTAMLANDSSPAVPAQIDPDQVSDNIEAINSALRDGFGSWLALRPDAERDGFVLVKMVYSGELQTSRDAERRTVDSGVEWVMHCYCLT